MRPSDEVVGWLQGLADMGCTFLEVDPDTKRTLRSWQAYERETGARGVASALRWLRRGSGAAIIPRLPLYCLDADSPDAVVSITETCLEAGTIPVMVHTPSGGAHFYFRLPGDFPRERLKNHVCHPQDADGVKLDMDFKFGPRTLLVAPGTFRPSKGMPYAPAVPWRVPPVADPRSFLPHGEFWKVDRPFLVCERPLKDRLARARFYLAHRAPVSRHKHLGHKTLMGVCTHLVVYLGLDPETALSLLTRGESPWNSRCLDWDGKPYPWSLGELHAACTSAVDLVPSAGVKAWYRFQAKLKAQAHLNAHVRILKESLTLPLTVRVPVARVLDAFHWLGHPELTRVALGDALVAHEIPRTLATIHRVRCIPGLDFDSMQRGIIEAEWRRQAQEGRTTGCALIKHLDSLCKVTRYAPRIESQVSQGAA